MPFMTMALIRIGKIPGFQIWCSPLDTNMQQAAKMSDLQRFLFLTTFTSALRGHWIG